MNWGKWIIVSFVLFAGFIGTLVTVCMREEVGLVSKDYYQEELAYQDQIIRISNTNQLEQKPVIQKTGNFIEITFEQFSEIENGALKLFRPSDAGMDRIFELKTQGKKQIFPVDELKKGMYRARMQWTMNGKEYYMEEVINI